MSLELEIKVPERVEDLSFPPINNWEHFDSTRRRSLRRSLPMIQDLLRFRRETLGKEHPATLATMYSLASGFFLLEDWSRASELLQEILDFSLRHFGSIHNKTQICFLNLLNTAVFAKDVAAIDQLIAKYRNILPAANFFK